MHTPLLLADAGILSEASPVSIGLVLALVTLLVGGIVSLVRGSTSTENEVKALRQDQNAEIAARREAVDAEARARREAFEAERQARERLLAELERRTQESEKDRRELRDMLHGVQKEQHGTGVLLVEIRGQYTSLSLKLDKLLMRTDDDQHHRRKPNVG